MHLDPRTTPVFLAAAALSGEGHIVLNNKIQLMVQAMMKLSGIQSENEAVNFILSKVSEPHITLYVNHVLQKTNTNTRRITHTTVSDNHTHLTTKILQ